MLRVAMAGERSAAGLNVIGNQGFGPERYPHSSDYTGGKKALQLPRRDKRQVLEFAFRDGGSKKPVILSLECAGQELNEWQVVVWLQWEPVIGRCNEPTLADAHDLGGKLGLLAVADDVFDYRIRKDNIEALVPERQAAAVQHGVRRHGVGVARGLDIIKPDGSRRDAVRV